MFFVMGWWVGGLDVVYDFFSMRSWLFLETPSHKRRVDPSFLGFGEKFEAKPSRLEGSGAVERSRAVHEGREART